MDSQNVLTRFVRMANIPSSEALTWQELASDCAADIASRIDSVYDTAQNSRVLESAAAALALYRYRVGLCTILSTTEQSSSSSSSSTSSSTSSNTSGNTSSDPSGESQTDTNISSERELTSFKVGDITLEFAKSSSSSASTGSGSSQSGSGSGSGSGLTSSYSSTYAEKLGSGVSEAYEMYKQALEACEQWFKKTTTSSEFIFGRMETLCTES